MRVGTRAYLCACVSIFIKGIRANCRNIGKCRKQKKQVSILPNSILIYFSLLLIVHVYFLYVFMLELHCIYEHFPWHLKFLKDIIFNV